MLFAAAINLASDLSFFSGEAIFALLALTMMEIVLGIDNIVFIAIVTGRLPEAKRPFARRVGLFLAMIMRIVLLMMIGWLMSLQATLFELSELLPDSGFRTYLLGASEVNEVSGRDLILLLGGLFLLFTAVREIHHKIEGIESDSDAEDLPSDVQDSSVNKEERVAVGGVLFRIAFMDMIFSLDSVITAVGMAKEIQIMVLAIIISVGVMIAFANQISDFVQTHPTVKMLALSFLMLIGLVLVSDAVGTPISKGYIYFAMVFSLCVEFLNLRMKFKRLRPSGVVEGETGTVRQSEGGE